MPRAYHHGNLREALVDAAFELARSGGPDAVVLRAVSRAAGVSHNAAYRHFADHEGLLTVVGLRCMDQLGALMIERTDAVRVRGAGRRARAKLVAVGRAYVDFARTEPGWFQTAFAGVPAPDSAAEMGMTPDLDPGRNPYLLLSARLDELVTTGELPVERRPDAEYAAWAAVHGVASLLVDGPMRYLPDDDLERAINTVLDVVSRGL